MHSTFGTLIRSTSCFVSVFQTLTSSYAHVTNTSANPLPARSHGELGEGVTVRALQGRAALPAAHREDGWSLEL